MRPYLKVLMARENNAFPLLPLIRPALRVQEGHTLLLVGPLQAREDFVSSAAQTLKDSAERIHLATL